MKINLKKFQELINNKLISVKKHPRKELYIYNYTVKCQCERVWTKETIMARGLITDKDGNILYRPFPKFFNFEEYKGKLPDCECIAYEKLDGSLGILYWEDDKPSIATRGSFESEQAKIATDIIRSEKAVWDLFDRNKTYLFEIIYPENRIVVDYGDVENLFLLAVIDNETGEEEDIEDIEVGFPKAKGKKLEEINLKELRENDNGNFEGYVLKWSNGFRLKVKMEEYLRLHKILTGLNEKAIWEIVSTDGNINELLERVPDEFYKWAREVVDNLLIEHARIEGEAVEMYKKVKRMKIRKNQAKKIKNNSEYPHLVFSLIDGKNITDLVWKIIKPRGDTPMKK